MQCRSLVLAVLLVIGVCGAAQAASRPSVVFLSPDDSRFWELVAGFMNAVASDLDIELEVQFDHERHRFSYLNLAQKVLSRPDKPDYLVFMCKEGVTERMLKLAGAAGVRVFTFNTDVPKESRSVLGLPREKLPYWIGHLAPDNVAAGQTLAQLLARHARDLGVLEPSQPLSTIALSGTRDSSAAKDRNLGLLKIVNGGGAKLSQLVHADWDTDEAQEKTQVLLKRYPKTASIWTASDGMALGAVEAARQSGRLPGVDLVIGGVDWEPQALDAIRAGTLTVSLGRHFMGGGLMLLLLHDYHQGVDFVSDPQKTSLRYRLEAATRANVDRVERILDPGNWQAVRFDRFSRARNSDREGRPPSATQLMDAFASALATAVY